jgi:hypothetical protein
MKFFKQRYFTFAFLLLLCGGGLHCNKPFQPEVEYTPKLNVYAVLFANSSGVYVRVMPVVQSPANVSESIHGAFVSLALLASGKTPVETTVLTDTTIMADGVPTSLYYAPARILPGVTYALHVQANGYPEASASVFIPFSYAAIPDQDAYSVMQNPKDVKSNIVLNITLSSSASAEFVQMFVECRGLDSTGNFKAASFNVIPVDSLNPFVETQSITTLPTSVDIAQYQAAFKSASQFAKSLRVSHLYADVVVTQIDDNLYRFFVTSNRTAAPLLMRTDKIIFSNIQNNAGTGIVAGACIDTTRIFLY